MLALLLAAALQEDDVEDVIRRFEQHSIVRRAKAAEEMVERGRPAIPLLRKVIASAEGEAATLARRVIGEIGKKEVTALLERAAVKGKAVRVEDAEFAKVLPHATVDVAPTTEPEDGAGDCERVVVLNDLADGKGAPVLLAKPADVAKAFAGTGEARAVARAALFLVRATQGKAHSAELVARAQSASDPDNWWKAEAYAIAKDGDGAAVSNVTMQFGHEWFEVTLKLSKEGRLAAVETKSTGRRCK